MFFNPILTNIRFAWHPLAALWVRTKHGSPTAQAWGQKTAHHNDSPLQQAKESHFAFACNFPRLRYILNERRAPNWQGPPGNEKTGP